MQNQCLDKKNPADWDRSATITRLQHLHSKSETLASMYPDAFLLLIEEVKKKDGQCVKICKQNDVLPNHMFGLIQAARYYTPNNK